jgi:hypothetical protein
VALCADDAIRADVEPAWWPGEWAVNPARVLDESAPVIAWVIRDGLALLVTSDIDALADAESGHDEPGFEPAATGACRAEEGMTLSGALRASAHRLIEARERSAVRAGSGVEVTRE